VVCFYVLFCFHDKNGTPSTPYIFCFVASITAKLVEFIVYISIEGFRVLGPLHCLYIAFWSMSCLVFCVPFCSHLSCKVFPTTALPLACVLPVLTFPCCLSINDSAYFVFHRGSIIQKRERRGSQPCLLLGAAKFHVASTSRPLGSGKPSPPSHASQQRMPFTQLPASSSSTTPEIPSCPMSHHD
jgi:hypothetical protein